LCTLESMVTINYENREYKTCPLWYKRDDHKSPVIIGMSSLFNMMDELIMLYKF